MKHTHDALREPAVLLASHRSCGLAAAVRLCQAALLTMVARRYVGVSALSARTPRPCVLRLHDS